MLQPLILKKLYLYLKNCFFFIKHESFVIILNYSLTRSMQKCKLKALMDFKSRLKTCIKVLN